MAQPKKFSPMRFTAATEEAAVEGAMQLVGAARDEISYDFISQTAKGVTIRIRPFDPETEAPIAEPVAEAESETDEEDEAEAPLHIDSMDDFDDDNDADENDFEASETSDSELDFDADLELADDEYDHDDEDFDADDSADDEELDDEDEPEIEIDAENLERALTLARTMLGKMGLEAQVERGLAAAPDIVPLTIEGEDVGILIGKHGATLQSFQYVMNLTLNNASDAENSFRVSVDAGNYRARRQESLEAVARSTAHRARRDNRPIKMEPMPANERRIVHDFLKTEAGISTQSEGREPHRCVVVAPGQSDYSGASESRNNRGARGMGGYGRGRGGRNRR